MTALLLRASVAAMSFILALTPAAAQPARMPIGGLRSPPPPQRPLGFPAFNDGVFVIESREVVHDIVVVHDQPAAQPAPAPSPPREPFVLGKSYASLPSGCMKLLADGAAYYDCSGHWYREVGDAHYKAVAAPL